MIFSSYRIFSHSIGSDANALFLTVLPCIALWRCEHGQPAVAEQFFGLLTKSIGTNLLHRTRNANRAQMLTAVKCVRANAGEFPPESPSFPNRHSYKRRVRGFLPAGTANQTASSRYSRQGSPSGMTASRSETCTNRSCLQCTNAPAPRRMQESGMTIFSSPLLLNARSPIARTCCGKTTCPNP